MNQNLNLWDTLQTYYFGLWYCIADTNNITNRAMVKTIKINRKDRRSFGCTESNNMLHIITYAACRVKFLEYRAKRKDFSNHIHITLSHCYSSIRYSSCIVLDWLIYSVPNWHMNVECNNSNGNSAIVYVPGQLNSCQCLQEMQNDWNVFALAIRRFSDVKASVEIFLLIVGLCLY